MIEIYPILPSIKLFSKFKYFNNLEVTETSVNIPFIIFNLTKSQTYIILEIGLFLGVGLKISEKDE